MLSRGSAASVVKFAVSPQHLDIFFTLLQVPTPMP